jgi:hypothetical protein
MLNLFHARPTTDEKDETMNLTDMTVPQLRSLAASFGVTGRSTMKKAELIAALSTPEIAELVALSVTVAEMSAADVADAATKEHEDEEIDLTSTIDNMIEGWLKPVEETPSVFNGAPPVHTSADGTQTYGPYVPSCVDSAISDHNPDTEGRPAAFDVVGDSAAAIIDQIAPNRVRFNTPPVQQVARTYRNEVVILRDAPGTAIVTAAFNGETVAGSIVRRGKRLVLTVTELDIRVKGSTFEQVAKRLAKAIGFHVDVIDVAREF